MAAPGRGNCPPAGPEATLPNVALTPLPARCLSAAIAWTREGSDKSAVRAKKNRRLPWSDVQARSPKGSALDS